MNLYTKESGTGQPMVLLHGNGEDSSYFVNQMSFFESKYHVIAVDTRGHGRSPVSYTHLAYLLRNRNAILRV